MELTNISQKEIAAQKAKGKRHLSCELSKGNHKSPRFLGAEYGTVPTDMDLFMIYPKLLMFYTKSFWKNVQP